MSVSVALIVRDEERGLARCLDSLEGAVDEVVVVDTGSKDDSKAVAHRYTDRVYDFAWRRDFAAARQFAFEKATGDWVAWVDADDVVLGAGSIRPLAEGAPDHVGAIYWRYVVETDRQGYPSVEFWRERCVRNDGTYRWVGRVHEVLVPSRPWAAIRSKEVVVEHRREATSGPEHIRRNLEIMEEELAASDGNPPPRLLLYLGRDRASAGDLEGAVEAYGRYLRVADSEDERYFAQTQLAGLYRFQRRWSEAIDADLQALKVCPHWPDAYFGLAQTYYFLRDWHKVVHWTEVGRAMPLPDTIQVVTLSAYRYDWIIYYTNALHAVGATREALEWTRRALEIRPDDPQHAENLQVLGRLLKSGAGDPEARKGKAGAPIG